MDYQAEFLKLVTDYGDLKRAEGALMAQIERLVSYFGMNGMALPTPETGAGRPPRRERSPKAGRPPSPTTGRARRVADALAADPGRTMSLHDLRLAIGEPTLKKANLNTVLSKLKRQGRIQSVGRGEYQHARSA